MTGCVNKNNERSIPIDELEDNQKEILIEKELSKLPLDTSNQNNEWTLVWNDEFHSDSSLLNWNLQDWPSEKNGELQYYSPKNIKVSNGLLVIESKKEKFKGRVYTSGALTTEDKFEFTYGKVEIKAKISRGKGVFPAFWLVNSTTDWLPEIDIMENLGQNPHEIHFVVHWKDSTGNKMRDYSQYENEAIDFSEEFHIYGLLWEKDKITWTIDGNPVFITEEFSPNTPLFIYFNTAIGGFWPGDPDPHDDYPKEMQIEYVRVFKKE